VLRFTLMTASKRRLFLSSLFLLGPAAAALAATRRRVPAVKTPVVPSLILPPTASEWDLTVAHACQRGLGRSGGGVVAMDPQTGRVLSIVNPANVLFRAYQPCSVFKIVVAIAGLTEGAVKPDTVYNCNKGCWSWPGHGPIDLRRALAVSCNPYFEWIGERIGYEKVQAYAQRMGLGAPSGINLTGETAGILPAKVRPEAVGHLSSHAAGIATSAIQLGVLISATINGGVVFQPQVADAEGFVPKVRWRLPEDTVMDGLAEGYVRAVNEGSAISAFDPDVVVAGKTGTCSSVGWFASYAPADQPRLVLVVFMRPGSGHGASSVAGRIYQEIFKPTAPMPQVGG
jgi:cell division protein FtsI/penicillin-binding protein 2